MKGTHLLLIVNTSTLENGAPPDKFGVLYTICCMEFNGLNSRINGLGLSHFDSCY